MTGSILPSNYTGPSLSLRCGLQVLSRDVRKRLPRTNPLEPREACLLFPRHSLWTRSTLKISSLPAVDWTSPNSQMMAKKLPSKRSLKGVFPVACSDTLHNLWRRHSKNLVALQRALAKGFLYGLRSSVQCVATFKRDKSKRARRLGLPRRERDESLVEALLEAEDRPSGIGGLPIVQKVGERVVAAHLACDEHERMAWCSKSIDRRDQRRKQRGVVDAIATDDQVDHRAMRVVGGVQSIQDVAPADLKRMRGKRIVEIEPVECSRVYPGQPRLAHRTDKSRQCARTRSQLEHTRVPERCEVEQRPGADADRQLDCGTPEHATRIALGRAQARHVLTHGDGVRQVARAERRVPALAVDGDEDAVRRVVDVAQPAVVLGLGVERIQQKDLLVHIGHHTRGAYVQKCRRTRGKILVAVVRAVAARAWCAAHDGRHGGKKLAARKVDVSGSKP
ncbi:hypothetical protein L1887_57811 [Cichorium endivia]|nr:hypothetical protein L1887_57811 [Cichorium endivia]